MKSLTVRRLVFGNTGVSGYEPTHQKTRYDARVCFWAVEGLVGSSET